MPKIYGEEFGQHEWIKVDNYLGSDGWFSPFGTPKYKRITKLDFKKIE